MTGVLIESLYGEPVERVAQMSQGVHGQGVPAFSTVEYIDPRERYCVGNDNTCGAFKVKGKEHCAGHLRGLDGDAG